ncbi:MAG: nuclear transport factor 2 family protein [Pedobacter sp.]|uniref:nuclear transport factor 2 family protein n=1 Tax=Pedobacter sp. TaxID=1411316 RepID=UPI00339373D8
MKKLSVILLIFASSLAANAQSKDETLVAAGVEKLRAAMISGNKADLESVLSNDLTYAHSSGKIQSKEVFVEEISTKKSDFVTIALTKQSISITGDVAIVSHQLNATTNDGGKPAAPHLNIVLVWKKTKSEWKLIARRAFHAPAAE